MGNLSFLGGKGIGAASPTVPKIFLASAPHYDYYAVTPMATPFQDAQPS